MIQDTDMTHMSDELGQRSVQLDSLESNLDLRDYLAMLNKIFLKFIFGLLNALIFFNF